MGMEVEKVTTRTGSGTHIGADDGGDDGRRDDNAANAETGNDQNTPELVDVVGARDGHGSATY